MSNQLPMFAGRVYQRPDGVWVATISDGWWLGYGRTKQAAIDAVMKVYRNGLTRW